MTPGWVTRWSDRVVLVSAFCLPLFVLTDAKDAFRLPKDAVLRAEAIVLVAIFVLGWPFAIGYQNLRTNWRKTSVALPLLILLWTFVTTVVSTNRMRSVDSLVTVAAAVVVFFATLGLARRSRMSLLLVVIVPAIINAAVGMLQEFDLWHPFDTPENLPHHQRSTALIGNPNDAGGYLAAIALASLAAAIVTRPRRVFVTTTILLVPALIVNQTLTAIVAFALAALVMIGFRSSWRRTAIGALVVVALFAITVAAFPPLRQRAINMRDWVRRGDYNALLTSRLTPFLAATMMAVRHPITGVGPNCFAWNYYTYKIEAEARFPVLRQSFNRSTNFGEVHNDHLQILAEGGVPAYALFLAALVALAGHSFPSRKPARGHIDMTRRVRERKTLAELLALPLAVEFAILALAQFPLELTAVSSPFFFLAALCVAWSGR